MGVQIEVPLNDHNCNRSKKAQEVFKKLSDYFVLSTTGKKMIETAQDKCDSMRASILFAYVDNFVSELDARFAIGSNVLKYVSALNPSSKQFLCPDTINEMVKVNTRSDIVNLSFLQSC